MPRLNIERQKNLEPQRIETAKRKIQELGYEIIEDDGTMLAFLFRGNKITFFPYSGWHSGKGIQDGRGLSNLLCQI